MKLLTIATLLLLASTSFAQDSKMSKEERVQKRKTSALAKIDKKISILNESKSCISSATDKESFKKCRKTAREKMKALREENKAEREQRKANRKSKRKNKDS